MSKQSKRSKGFTLIELLIVVAIVGILAALLVPNAMTAMQRARQKGTQKDLITIATNIADYTVDHGSAPAWDGSVYTRTSSIYTALVPFYIKGIPATDQWGNNIVINSGSSWSSAWLGMTPTSGATDEFALGSPGRNTTFAFDYSSTGVDFFTVTSTSDFNKDLVIWDGNWVSAPRTTTTGS